jgi:uncharacterized protein (TIGR03083 family)
MESDELLPAARTAVEVLSDQVGTLLRELPSAEARIEGSEWSIRDAAAHLICLTTLYSELTEGAVSPINELTPAACARFSAQRLADIAVVEPATLAKSMTAAIEGFVEVTSRRTDSTPITFHGGVPLNLGQLACVLLGEYLLHGYDIAGAAGAPWPIEPAHAALVLGGNAPLNPYCVNPATAHGHTATYVLRLGTAGTVIARFTEGVLSVEPGPDASVEDSAFDCVIAGDPVAFLLVSYGRLSQWTAIALGLMSASGRHPELAAHFGALFHRF